MGIATKFEERYLFVPKILYFVVNMQYYTLHQFRSIFCRSKFGVSTSTYGKMSGIILFCTFFTNIMVGGVSDKTGRPKAVLIFLTMATAVLFSLFYVPSIMGIGAASFWAVLFLYLIFNNPKQPLLDKIVLDYLSKMSIDAKVYGKQRMWGTVAYAFATFVSEWCLNIGAVTDSKGKTTYNFTNLLYYSCVTTVMALLAFGVLGAARVTPQSEETSTAKEGESGTHEDAKAEAAQRQASLSSTQEQRINEGIEKPTNRSQSSRDEQASSNDRNTTSSGETGSNSSTADGPAMSMTQEYIFLLKNKEFLFFFFIILSNAITRSAMSIYLTTFHNEVLKLKPYSLPSEWPEWVKTLVGIFNKKPITALTIFGTFFEIVVMFVAQPILSKLGFFWPLLIAQVCSLFRFFAYYTLSADNPHTYAICCFIELIKGLYFGLAHISAVQIATSLAPPHLKATSQMIYQGTFNAMGSLMGGFIFGKMFDSVKDSAQEGVYRQLFLINGFISFITILVYFYKYGIKDRVLFNREAEEEKLGAAGKAAIAV